MSAARRHLTTVSEADAAVGAPADADALLVEVAKGDAAAFAALYDMMSPQVYGVVRRVLRDPAQSEEVAQDVLVEVWRTAPRFDRSRGTARSWVLTIAHRRAVDRVRSEQASRDREDRVGRESAERPFDAVADQVEQSLETEQVRAALDALTDVQREAIELAYYGGNTYREVAALLEAPVGTVKTRMRDGLIRLRDAMGVTA
ncbi:ECF RNA polymerase sigma factor SigK [Euzebya sp.]|uniref:ECF RNA polymerase sigma factor SigK n=1 Tax=Euzebya sp. TaxID=1971409 RepID=UPI003514A839